MKDIIRLGLKYIVPVLLALFFLSCFKNTPRTYMSGDVKCTFSESNKYAQMSMSYRNFVINSDSTMFNEMRIHCVNNSFLTKQIMFDNYGVWDRAVYPNGNYHPMLIWENVDLLSNGIKYDVFTDGIEASYISVMVFDEQGQDVLSEESKELDTLSKYFMEQFKMLSDTSAFEEQYWKMVDPKHWERLKRYRNR